ncbi:MAG: phosphate ABC transporter permease subunit PstC [Candidatus Desulfofervidaceae bacterium]|nr:phosphate ABC transporter permease subunit PstC [Candidatus Desulfofervidaceae bacterium]
MTFNRDKLFEKSLTLSAWLVVILVAAMCLSLVLYALPVFRTTGFGFLFHRLWDPLQGKFGAMPFLVGTLLTSFLALLFSLPFSLAIAIFLGEYFNSGKIALFFQNTTSLLAGIPSVIYGFWGLFVLVPLVRKLEIKLGVLPYGVGIFTASLILSIMIIPYAASVGREVISLVPSELKEAAYALGATRWEVIRHVIFPYARSGIFAGILLSLGRAIGETMAVTMVIGNNNQFPTSLFAPANTMASVIANEFTEATSDVYLSALIAIALLLFLVTTVINIIGRYIIEKLSV